MNKNLLRWLFWEWIEPLGVALCIALLVMHTIAGLYVIPTGSMQPTLKGAGDYGWGDKVIVNKFIYHFEEPQRWDVFVFDYPFLTVYCSGWGCRIKGASITHLKLEEDTSIADKLNCPECKRTLKVQRREFIKRLVGMPNDVFKVQNGNIILQNQDNSWYIPKKTTEAQDALWIPFFNSEKDGLKYWKHTKKKSLSEEPMETVLLKDGDQLVWDSKNRPITGHKDANNGKNNPKGVPPREDYNPNYPEVSDIKIRLELEQLPQQGSLTIGLGLKTTENRRLERTRRFFAKLDFKQQKVSLYDNTSILKDDLEITSGSVSFSLLDGYLNFNNGEQKYEVQVPNYAIGEITSSHEVTPTLMLKGTSELTLSILELSRDIFYAGPFDYLGRELYKPIEFYDGSWTQPAFNDKGVCRIPEGQYLAMGDNVYKSSDSRSWGFVSRKDIKGKAVSVFFPFWRLKNIQ